MMSGERERAGEMEMVEGVNSSDESYARQINLFNHLSSPLSICFISPSKHSDSFTSSHFATFMGGVKEEKSMSRYLE